MWFKFTLVLVGSFLVVHLDIHVTFLHKGNEDIPHKCFDPSLKKCKLKKMYQVFTEVPPILEIPRSRDKENQRRY